MSRRRKKHRLPPPNARTTALLGLRLESYTVGDWCPTQDGTGPATAVGLSLRVAGGSLDGADLVLRLKTPEAVDTLIQSLLRHKRSVWPDAK